MVDAILDNPALAALNYGQADLGRISELAAVYDPRVSPLAGVVEPSTQALRELAQLVPPATGIAVLGATAELPESPRWQLIRVMPLKQMICDAPPTEFEAFEDLRDADVAEMLELAQLTEPGPFLERTIAMGRYVGVRSGGRLVAMAGERMKPPGWIEISGVCTHPEARGFGLASRMVTTLLAHCFAQDQRAFLHVVEGSPSEQTAIGVYERLGFRLRRSLFAHVLLRTEEAP